LGRTDKTAKNATSIFSRRGKVGRDDNQKVNVVGESGWTLKQRIKNTGHMMEGGRTGGYKCKDTSPKPTHNTLKKKKNTQNKKTPETTPTPIHLVKEKVENILGRREFWVAETDINWVLCQRASESVVWKKARCEKDKKGWSKANLFFVMNEGKNPCSLVKKGEWCGAGGGFGDRNGETK